MSSSQQLYKRFINLCQKWPKDESKYGRDFGEYFRNKLTPEFPHGEASHLENPRKVDEAISALERIAENRYFSENPLKRSSASGLEGWACKEAVSTDNLRELQEQEENTLIKKLSEALNFKFLLSNESKK